MSIPYRERRRLRRLDRALRRSDLSLALKLEAFARINAEETMPSQEQLRPGLARPWRALWWPMAGAAFLVTIIAGGGSGQARRATALPAG